MTRYASSTPSVGSWALPGYGKYVGARDGKVRIGYRADDGKVRYRRVGIAPVFDPDALSMKPIRGWKASRNAIVRASLARHAA